MIFATRLALAFAVPAIALAQAPPLEFKGVPLGATEAQLLEKYPAFHCRDDEKFGRLCTFHYESYGYFCQSKTEEPFQACIRQRQALQEFGPTNPTMYIAKVRHSTVQSVDIMFPADDFRAVAAALAEKYGRPTREGSGVVKNRMGAAFDNRTVEWTRRDGKLRIEQRGSSIVESVVSMTTPKFQGTEATEISGKTKAAASKL